MNKDASDKYEIANKELNDVYNKILKQFKSDTTFIKNLKKSQNLWTQFRDAEMNVKFPDRPRGSYGSVLPMCWAMYKEKITKDRTKTLMDWVNGFVEGDACAGSLIIIDE